MDKKNYFFLFFKKKKKGGKGGGGGGELCQTHPPPGIDIKGCPIARDK